MLLTSITFFAIYVTYNDSLDNKTNENSLLLVEIG